jgi:ABC-type sugar transport system permease subunit
MMTRGGPAGNTTTIIYYLYQYGFEFFEVGYASSVALLLFVLLFALTWLQFAVSRKWVHYG